MIFIKLLLNYLGNEQNRGLQFHAVAIIRQVVAGSTNRKVVKQYITPSIILDLVSSKDRELQVQAMWLLRTIALGIPDHHEIETILEKALDPVISFLSDDSPSPEMIYLGALTLATFCQVYPNLPQEKSKLVPLALRNLIQYDTEQHLAEANLPYVCMTLTYLRDGREAMVVEDYFFGEVIDHLIVIIDSDSHLIANGGLGAVGGIVRWASDDHIQDVIRCKCIETLVSVVQNFKFIEGRKEAAWAILNAICTCLIVLVKMEVVMVNCNGKLIDNVQFKNDLIMLQERQFQLVDDIDGLPKSKKLGTTNDLGKYDSDMEYLITSTFEEDSDLQQPGTPSISIHNGNLGHVRLAADPMEVE